MLSGSTSGGGHVKRCPRCDAQYDDHVLRCYIHDLPLLQVADADPGSSRSRWAWFIPVVLAVLILPVVVVTAFVIGMLRNAPVTEGLVATPAPPRQVVLTSSPPDAEVVEGDEIRCRTPCTLEQGPNDPMPRRFRLQFDAHAPRDLTVHDVGTYHVELVDGLLAEAGSGDSPSAEDPRIRNDGTGDDEAAGGTDRDDTDRDDTDRDDTDRDDTDRDDTVGGQGETPVAEATRPRPRRPPALPPPEGASAPPVAAAMPAPSTAEDPGAGEAMKLDDLKDPFAD